MGNEIKVNEVCNNVNFIGFLPRKAFKRLKNGSITIRTYNKDLIKSVKLIK